MKRHRLIILLLLFKSILFSQSAKQEIVKINKAYYDHSQVAMRIVNKAYKGNDEKPVSESQLEVYKTDGKFLFRSLSSESMSNGNYKINLDTKKKLIVINKISHTTPPAQKHDLQLIEGSTYNMALDTVLNYYKEVKLNSKNATQNEMEFIFKNGTYESIKITYDRKTYLVYDYNIKVKASAKNETQAYTYVITNYYYNMSALKKRLFNEGNYVVIKKGEIVPSANYAGYKIIDNINKKSAEL